VVRDVDLGTPLNVDLGSLHAEVADGGIVVQDSLSVLAAGPAEGHTCKNVDCLEPVV